LQIISLIQIQSSLQNLPLSDNQSEINDWEHIMCPLLNLILWDRDRCDCWFDHSNELCWHRNGFNLGTDRFYRFSKIGRVEMKTFGPTDWNSWLNAKSKRGNDVRRQASCLWFQTGLKVLERPDPCESAIVRMYHNSPCARCFAQQLKNHPEPKHTFDEARVI
jgi:hypothetical protein